LPTQLADALFLHIVENVQGRYNGISLYKGPKLTIFGRGTIPSFLVPLIDLLTQRSLICLTPHQVTINQYVTSNHGIIPHKDGHGQRAVIVTLGSTAKIDFFYQPEEWEPLHTQVYTDGELSTTSQPISLILEPRSAILLTGPSFKDYAHGINAAEVDEVTEDLANIQQLSHPVGSQLPRGIRISIVIWTH